MQEESERDDESVEPKQLVEGLDFYLDMGLVVFTAEYLGRRGFCCESGCRHCPYGFRTIASK